MNVLNCMFSLFTQRNLCLRRHGTLGGRLNFTLDPKLACLPFMKLLSLLAAEELGDPELMKCLHFLSKNAYAICSYKLFACQ